jgi:hypothetical protein
MKLYRLPENVWKWRSSCEVKETMEEENRDGAEEGEMKG